MFNKSSFFLFIIVKLYIKFLIIQKLYERKGCLTRHPFHYVYKEFRLYFIPSNFILSKRNPIVFSLSETNVIFLVPVGIFVIIQDRKHLLSQELQQALQLLFHRISP